jgi:hypothetical protein
MLRKFIFARAILLLVTITVWMQLGLDARSRTSQLNRLKYVTSTKSTLSPDVSHFTTRSQSDSFFARSPTLCTWVGGPSGNWDVPGNWSCGQVPTVNSDVEINLGTVTLNVNAEVKTLKVGSTGGITVLTGKTVVIDH